VVVRKTHAENLLISRILVDQDLTTPLDVNLSSRYFGSETAREAWEWILAYRAQYAVVPDMDVFRRRHPAFEIDLAPREPMVALIDEVYANYKRRLTTEGLASAVEYYQQTNDDRAAWEILNEHRQRYEAAPGTANMKLLTLAELFAREAHPALIDQWLPQGQLCEIYGTPNSGKSFMALDMALCVATGKPWAGHEVTQGDVIYVAAEGGIGYKKRIPAWMQHNGVEELTHDSAFMLLEDNVDVRDDVFLSDLTRFIEVNEVKLVVIDTLSLAMPGVDENSATEVNVVVNGLRNITKRTGTTILWIHHPAKSGSSSGSRGSGALYGTLDISIHVAIVNENDTEVKPTDVREHHVVRAHLVKNREGAVGLKKHFKRLPVGYSLVLDRLDADAPKRRTEQTRDKVFDFYEEHWRRHSSSPSYDAAAAALKMSRSTVRRRVSNLQHLKLLDEDRKPIMQRVEDDAA
jgi:hypothetical protein